MVSYARMLFVKMECLQVVSRPPANDGKELLMLWEGYKQVAQCMHEKIHCLPGA